MIYDVSVPITNAIPVWPEDPAVKLTPKSQPAKDRSHTIQLTEIRMGSHVGTHVDAPYHMIKTGRKLHEIPLDRFVGPVTVFAFENARSITRDDLERLDWTGVKRVLFKTDNSKHWNDGRFYEHFAYLETGGAEFLVEVGIKLVGIDYLSIEKFQSSAHPTHMVLMRGDIAILEGLNLLYVPPGRYCLAALPLSLYGADGAPTRAILMDE